MLYVLCTSKPSDGLLHYSYEYTHKLNEAGMETKCLFFPSEGFTKQDYIDAINNKYRVYDHVMFDDEIDRLGSRWMFHFEQVNGHPAVPQSQQVHRETMVHTQ